MKIYCSRRSQTTEELLNSVVGKNIWVLADYRNGLWGDPVWLKPIRMHQDHCICDAYWITDHNYPKRIRNYIKKGSFDISRITISEPVEFIDNADISTAFVDDSTFGNLNLGV